MHAANVVSAVRKLAPDVQVDGVGGASMARAGATIVHPIDRLAAMGLFEAAHSLPRHVRLLLQLRRQFTAGHYSVAVLVDYPGFHMSVAAAAAACGVPVLYYVAPQMWAWGAWRVRLLRKNVRAMAVVLPFEEQFFKDRGIEARFVGHPLLDRGESCGRTALRNELGVTPSSVLLGLFPGSRSSEIGRHWPTFRKASDLLRQTVPGIKVVVAGTAAGSYPERNDVVIWYDRQQDLLAACDVVLTKSGTTTLEAALADTPLVIAYRMHSLTYAVARRAVRVGRVGLVNLLSEQDAAPEFIQNAATPAALADALRPLLDREGEEASRQRERLAGVRRQLGTPGAGLRVAEMALQLAAS
jgi:lipid-A-disaccharide synthase